METFNLPCYNGKQGNMTFRNPANVEEMAAWCNQHSRIWFKSVQGDAREAKINGRVKRWKRDPNRIEVPVKYGLYECGTFTADDIKRILIPMQAPNPGNAPTISNDGGDPGMSPALSPA